MIIDFGSYADQILGVTLIILGVMLIILGVILIAFAMCSWLRYILPYVGMSQSEYQTHNAHNALGIHDTLCLKCSIHNNKGEHIICSTHNSILMPLFMFM